MIWEEQKRLRRWKAISHELKNQLEALYSKNAEKEGEVQIPNTDYTVSALPVILWYGMYHIRNGCLSATAIPSIFLLAVAGLSFIWEVGREAKGDICPS